MTRRSIGRGFAAALAAMMAIGCGALAQPATAAASASSDQSATLPARSGATPNGAQRQGAPAPSHVGTAHQDGSCDQYSNGHGDFCLYYLDNYQGSFSDFYTNDDNLWDNYFLTSGSGRGRVVANNARSYWNRDLICTVWVYTGSYYTGNGGRVTPGEYDNFNTTYRDNVESLRWVC